MKLFRSDLQLQKFINWVAKVATLLVSAPATISVAQKAYSDVPGVFQWVVIGACVVLVEASFVYFWVRVEYRSGNAARDEQLQAGNVLGCWVMYGILLYAGVLHGEGMLTLLFRASIGLLLFIATRDRLVLTKSKIEDMISNGDYLNRKIQSAQRKSDEKVAMERIKRDRQLRLELIRKDPSKKLAALAEQNVFAMLHQYEEAIPKVKKVKKRRSTDEAMMENEFYSIEQIDDEFEVTCKRCDWHTLRPSRKAAALSGNSHQRVHTNGHGSNGTHVRMFVEQESTNE